MPWPLRRLLLAILLLALLLSLALISGLLGGSSGDGDQTEDPDRSRRGPSVGRVTTASGAPPPPGTRVFASGPGGSVEARLGPSGEFGFDRWPEGAVVFEASCGPLRARAEPGRSGVEIVLPDHFDLAGRVGDAVTGEPIEGAEVRCGGRTGRTGPRGRFRVAAVPAATSVPEVVEVRSEDHVDLDFRPPIDAAWDDLFLQLEPR